MEVISKLPTIRGWIAREDAYLNKGRLLLFGDKPSRDGNCGWKGECFYTVLANYLFPYVTWYGDPIEVELIINPIKRKED